MEQILLAYSLPKETVTAIMMLYKNMKTMVHSPDGNTDFFDVVSGVLQRNTLEPFIFIIYLDYVLQTSIDLIKESDFSLKKKKKRGRSRQYPTETITDPDYTDDLALFANTSAQAELLLHCLKQASRGIGLNMNSEKTKFKCFKQEGAISTLNNKPLKIVNHSTYLGSKISSTESNVTLCIRKTQIAIDWLLTIWKSDLSDKIKLEFFQAVAMSVLLYGCTTKTLI